MGTAERKEREKERRRLDIIEAAENVFFSKGYEKATMDDVAKEAELGKGTLYLYFNSKEEIYNEIISRGMTILYNLFSEAGNDNGDGLCKTRKIGEAYIQFFKQYPNYYNAVLFDYGKEIDPDNVPEKLMELKTKIMGLFISIIQEGIDDGSIRSDLDPAKTAVLLWAEAAGVLQLMKYKGTILNKALNLDEEEFTSYFFEFTFNALKK